MLSILKNTWYAAAYSHELGEGTLARTLIDQKAVLFRDSHGEAAMILNRCPHRFAPLSAGRIIDDTLECPYHGLRFNRDGECVLNPHSKTKAGLPAANIRAWPLLERYGIIWFWPGDPAKADPALLPVIDFLEQPDDYAVVRGLLHVKGHYELVVDNLLDLSHAAFIHPQFSGGNYTPEQLLAATTQRLERGDRWITNHRIRSGLGPSSAHVGLFGMDPKVVVETDTTMTWHPPAMLDFKLGSWEVGQPRESGAHIPQLHIITPETEFTSHYFFVNGRNRRRDEPEVDQALLDFFDMAFRQQDEPMIEMVQENMGAVSDIIELNPILLATDTAPVSARRMLADLIARERAEETSASLNAPRAPAEMAH
ncbi:MULTISPECIES: aromatic ring-hydroxylating dioxygenase subunit alpha [unclassified Sphingobium]|uniref:aromatic ring-hydroxylating dioxygenase subunit alpha n=1 Tax=unclassified Sphingobium TaxID=2611147 RepID=UPI0022249451|nr:MULTISPECIES: aromatic ring-hydroxylating dioxygenase subunit alpha [unclassified Sphingobium]MCW2412655.1 vanillate O-demethylase monooxygenase subunit [Sphingobium sp. B8D3D]MCW2415047.1 vanillate O-demethylase monooxygenase subunit [Sphingobium sp. B8D3A]